MTSHHLRCVQAAFTSNLFANMRSEVRWNLNLYKGDGYPTRSLGFAKYLQSRYPLKILTRLSIGTTDGDYIFLSANMKKLSLVQ
jgi:hypothetical protein